MKPSRILLIGGGHAHIEVIRQFPKRFRDQSVQMILVSHDPGTVYSGMMPGVVAGHYAMEDCLINLPALCEDCGVEWVQARFVGLESPHCALLEDGSRLEFDFLSLDIGSRPDFQAIAGAEPGQGAKPALDFLHRWQQFVDFSCQIQQAHSSLVVTVVGGGVAAVELILAMQYRLERLGEVAVRWQLVAGSTVLAGHNRLVQARARRALRQAGVRLEEGVRVLAERDGLLELSDGRSLPSDFTLLCTPAVPVQPLPAEQLPLAADGFVAVDNCLRIKGTSHLFAVGDIASFPEPLAKSGVYAVRQGPLLARNLAATLAGQPLTPYRPQPRFLKLISLGGQTALASRGWFYASGPWVWRWKNRIDTRFMERYQR